VLAIAAPVQAITFGHLDGDGHPNVGSMVVITPDGNESFCTGTLVSPTVFVTASHCTIALEQAGIAPHDIWVTFSPVVDHTSVLLRGTYHTNPLYGHDQSDPHDIAVVVLDEPAAGITPAHLPTAGLLDQLSLRDQRFITVGYGTVRESKTRSWASLFWDPQRRWADQGFRSLTKSWLNLSMNPSTGSGGTCYGDSGGPHFLGDSDVVVAITVTGDAPCRATDVTYRLDTPSSRSFLAEFVALP
jgi:secreted trypsin-like serine protease